MRLSPFVSGDCDTLDLLPELYTEEAREFVSIYLEAERITVETINRKRIKGHVDYGQVAALNRIQNVLGQMEDDRWSYSPLKITEKHRPDTKLHPEGYSNAQAHIGFHDCHATMRVMVMTLLGEDDLKARLMIRAIAVCKALGSSMDSAGNLFREYCRDHGFEDDSSKIRPSEREDYRRRILSFGKQCSNAAMLYRDPGHDLLVADFDEYFDLQQARPDLAPKTFQTFQRHKMKNSEKYQEWKKFIGEVIGARRRAGE